MQSDPLTELQAGRRLVRAVGSTDRALEVLDAIAKLPSIEAARKAVERWKQVADAAGDDAAAKVLDAVAEATMASE